MKHSPGCKCCKSCKTTDLLWTPSSPYDRGEYTDDDKWQPYTEYFMGDVFWMFALDRDGVEQKFLFTVIDAAMFSGPGWTQIEEDRYSRGKAISYADGLEDFELLTNAVDEAYGWPTDQIDLHAALQERKLREGQGLISRKELAKDEWIANWNTGSSDFVNNQQYDDYEMDSLRLRVKFMGSAEYDSSVDSEPKSGIVTLCTKAAPMERLERPHPESCLPLCYSQQAMFPNNGIECDGYPPPYPPQFKYEHGVFFGDDVQVDETWAKSDTIGNLRLSRRITPQGAAVYGPLDIQSLIETHGDPENPVLDMHSEAVVLEVFGRGQSIFQTTMDWTLQNLVVVATTSGTIEIGSGPIEVAVGDIIQVVDFTRVLGGYFNEFDSEKGLAYEHIPAEEIIEVDQTASVIRWNSLSVPDTTDNDIVYGGTVSNITGGKVAIFVEELSDTDFEKTRDGSYYIEVGLNVCRVSTPISLSSPECERVLAYECDCRNLLATSTPLDLTNLGNYNVAIVEDIYDFPDYSLGEEVLFEGGDFNVNDGTDTRFLVRYVNELVEENEQFIPAASLPVVRTQDCQSPSGYTAFLFMSKLYRRKVLSAIWTTPFAKDPLGIETTYFYETRVIMFWQRDETQIHNCVGGDRFVMARSIADVTGLENEVPLYEPLPFGDSGDWSGLDGSRQYWSSEQLAASAIDRSITWMFDIERNMAHELICGNTGFRYYPRWKTSMKGPEESPRQYDQVVLGGYNGPFNNQAASLLTQELVRDAQQGSCSYAISAKYPSQQEQDSQLGERPWESLVVNREPGVSFSGSTITIATTTANP